MLEIKDLIFTKLQQLKTRDMENDPFKEIKNVIVDFQQSLQRHLPALVTEVNRIIGNHCKDKEIIENTLDTLLSLTKMGVGNDMFVKLLEYYKTIDSEGAAFYWSEYDEDEEG